MDIEESKARTLLKEAALQHGINLEGGKLRRTSSRLALSVEHGDYNGTSLFGIGSDRFLWFAFRPTGTSHVKLFSINFPDDGVVEFDCNSPPPPPLSTHKPTGWAHFAHGVYYTLSHQYHVDLSRAGLEGVIYGNIPGGGMSRSASLCINLIVSVLEAAKNTGKGVEDLLNPHKQAVGECSSYQQQKQEEKDEKEEKKERFRIVEMAQKVENDYIGSPCGILDQVMITFAKANTGTLYNPTTQEISYIPFGGDGEKDLRFLVMDTGTKRHGLETCKYPIRVAECRRAAGILDVPNIAAIKTEQQFQRAMEAIKAALSPAEAELVCRRVQYIYQAQRRLDQLITCWKNGDAKGVGQVFRLDGHGLRDQYDISGPELEAMCDIARTVPEVYGERMLGGGEKGASGLICAPSAVPLVRQAIATSYPRGHPDYAHLWAVHECKMVDGVVLLSPLL